MCNGVVSTAAARGASATQDDDADCELVSRCFRLDARGDQRLGSPAKPAASAQQPLRIDVARGGRFVIPAQAGPTQDSSFPTPVGLIERAAAAALRSCVACVATCMDPGPSPG